MTGSFVYAYTVKSNLHFTFVNKSYLNKAELKLRGGRVIPNIVIEASLTAPSINNSGWQI